MTIVLPGSLMISVEQSRKRDLAPLRAKQVPPVAREPTIPVWQVYEMV